MLLKRAKIIAEAAYGSVVTKFAVNSLRALVIPALVSGGVSYYFTNKQATELAVKQQNTAEVQRFLTSGAALDSSYAAFADAIIDKVEINKSRAALREAIAKHSADAFAMQRIFGETTTNSYLSLLAGLREQVDIASSVTNSNRMQLAFLDALSARRRLAANATGLLVPAS